MTEKLTPKEAVLVLNVLNAIDREGYRPLPPQPEFDQVLTEKGIWGAAQSVPSADEGPTRLIVIPAVKKDFSLAEHERAERLRRGREVM